MKKFLLATAIALCVTTPSQAEFGGYQYYVGCFNSKKFIATDTCVEWRYKQRVFFHPVCYYKGIGYNGKFCRMLLDIPKPRDLWEVVPFEYAQCVVDGTPLEGDACTHYKNGRLVK